MPIEIQINRAGDGKWERLEKILVNKDTGVAYAIYKDLDAQWIRLVAKGAAEDVSAYFHLSTPYKTGSNANQFDGLADITEKSPNGATLQLPGGNAMKLNVFSRRHAKSKLMEI